MPQRSVQAEADGGADAVVLARLPAQVHARLQTLVQLLAPGGRDHGPARLLLPLRGHPVEPRGRALQALPIHPRR